MKPDSIKEAIKSVFNEWCADGIYITGKYIVEKSEEISSAIYSTYCTVTVVYSENFWLNVIYFY